jgi:hypothetical protein
MLDLRMGTPRSLPAFTLVLLLSSAGCGGTGSSATDGGNDHASPDANRPSDAPHPVDAGPDAETDGGSDAARDAARDASPSDARGDAPGSSGYVAMGPPTYSGSTWTTANLTNDEDFSSLKNWNYGITDDNTSGGSGGYLPWGASGSAPYWGSLESTVGVLDYDLPGNVFQTSTGADTTLYSSYSPQTFHATGWGVSFTAHYTGSRSWDTEPYGDVTESWTSGAINSYNNISFPSGSHTRCYVQIKAQMMGQASSDNGAWNALWFLGQGNEQREIDLQETGLSGQSPDIITSHLQTPPVEIDSYTSASDLSAGYHIYGMQLVDQVVTIYLDNVLVGTATSGTTGPYFLIMNGAIASGMYGAAPTDDVDMTMNVMEVQVYQS